MTWDSPMTYCLDLDELTPRNAVFKHYLDPREGPSGVALALPRDHWQEMGRPSRIEITPKSA